MADGALFIGWGQPVRGREEKSLQVFNEVLEYYGRLQQQGQIESFEPFLLEPHGGDLAGFLLVRGEQAKLQALRYSEDFIRLNGRAALVVENFGVVTAFTGAELQRQFGDYQTQIESLA